MSELLRHALAEVFVREEIDDPVLAGVAVTVTEVRVSPDLRSATAFVMPLGGGDRALVVKALNRHTRFVRGELARRVELKFMPTLAFKLDDSFDRSERIEKLLRSPKVAQDLK